MNRYAEIIYGRVNYVFETQLQREDLGRIFSPDTFWVDITGTKVNIGWWWNGQTFEEPPESEQPTVQDHEYVNPDTLALAGAVLELSVRLEKLEGGTAR